MNVIGITGEIATGKSSISDYLAKKGYKVFNADNEVAALFSENSFIEDVRSLEENLVKENKIDKKRLSEIAFSNKKILNSLEKILHPKIQKLVLKFINNNKAEKFIFLDIPLLFEGGYDKGCDFVIYLECSYKSQLQRFLLRDNGDEKKLQSILEKQRKFCGKKKKSNFIINSDCQIEEMFLNLEKILEKI